MGPVKLINTINERFELIYALCHLVLRRHPHFLLVAILFEFKIFENIVAEILQIYQVLKVELDLLILTILCYEVEILKEKVVRLPIFMDQPVLGSL